ncbi:polysaccharide pyruvyl transferase family protein [Malikia sp.]|uniref:polysaccharide pyruvyl transferase family protein n=1 Tax=Malikia sp. TaxID=2070706 RepID=UPI002626DDEA|nr:polysaccharide pyruvyl transferase family protein [Malikia sp.]MDD2729519.1 polysaccharide pyruvyl transferase family protein [Malikia sp.]
MKRPLILFGAFDRHNFGDLLLARVASALLPGRELHFAGLAARDLRPWGGPLTRALPELLAERAPRRPDLLHVGGEILDCSAWQAAVMLLAPDQAQATIAYLEPRPAERTAWVERVTGGQALAPYVASRAHLPALHRTFFAGVGGVGLDRAPSAQRTEVLAALRAAAFVSVRDRVTRATLLDAGIPARLLPDPAVLVVRLFGDLIQHQAGAGELAALRGAFPHGYLALQISAEFADDACLAALAAALRAVLSAAGLGLVLFRAGLAPWHDDLGVLQRLAARLPAASVRIMASAHLWDICGLISCSRGYAGSSLHGRIVATACGLPRLSLVPSADSAQSTKLAAYLRSWELPGLPLCVLPAGLAQTLWQALSVDAHALQRRAESLATSCRTGLADLQGWLGLRDPDQAA